MEPTQLDSVKMENQHEIGWLYLEEQFKTLELPSPLASSFDFDPYLFSNQNKSHPILGFRGFEDFSGELQYVWDDNLQSLCENTDAPQLDAIFDGCDHGNGGGITKDEEEKKRSGRSKSVNLELDEIKKHFDVPITKAAKEMNVGLTVLKKRCRELNIMRWPHRKIKSLKSLIDNVKEMGLTSEVKMLEEHKKLLEKLPEMQLTEKTKKLRQACFKANYKKRRSLAALA